MLQDKAKIQENYKLKVKRMIEIANRKFQKEINSLIYQYSKLKKNYEEKQNEVESLKFMLKSQELYLNQLLIYFNKIATHAGYKRK